MSQSQPDKVTCKHCGAVDRCFKEETVGPDGSQATSYMCVNCGSKDGEPMRWDKSIVTKLQKGHMDPDKDLTEDNCVPQCGFCNQRYKDKAVFDKRGQVIRLR